MFRAILQLFRAVHQHVTVPRTTGTDAIYVRRRNPHQSRYNSHQNTVGTRCNLHQNGRNIMLIKRVAEPLRVTLRVQRYGEENVRRELATAHTRNQPLTHLTPMCRDAPSETERGAVMV